MCRAKWEFAIASLFWASVFAGLMIWSRLSDKRLRAEAVVAFENFERDCELRIVSLRECRWLEYFRLEMKGGGVAYRVTVVDQSGQKRDCWLMYGSLSPGVPWHLRVEWLDSPDPEAF